MQVLKFICKELNRTDDVRWVFAGSASLALQGVNVSPRDIDILTDRKGAFKIGTVLKKYEVRSVSYSETDKLASFFGVFEIDGFKLEVMGDYKEKQGDKWVSLSKRLEDKRVVEVDGVRMPVSPLEDQLKSYRRSERPKDVEKIGKIMQETDE